MTFSTPFSKFLFFFFFFNDTATTEIYTLSLHDALPIYLGPERGGDEGAGGGGALLPLVLEGAACERGRERGDVSRGVGEDEVLAAGLADDPRIAPVRADAPAHGLPHPLERRGRAGEVDAREIGRGERRVADLGARARHHVDDARREPRRLQNVHDDVGGVHGRGGGLPDDRVAHDRRRRRQVAADRGKVERRDREDEALERPGGDVGPAPGRREGLP